MENATKALLIAGSILISIIVLTIGILLYNAYSNQAQMYNQTIEIAEIQKFNSQFEVYLGREEDITAQEIVTIVKLAEKYEKQGITIDIQVKENEFNTIDLNGFEKIEYFVRDNLDTKFSCIFDGSETSKKNPVYDEEGKISKLLFTKK